MMLITDRFKVSVLFAIDKLLDKSLGVLQLSTHESNLTINGQYCNSWLHSLGPKLIRVGWISHFWLLKDTHLVWFDALSRAVNNQKKF